MHDCMSECACDQQPEMNLAYVAIYHTNAGSAY